MKKRTWSKARRAAYDERKRYLEGMARSWDRQQRSRARVQPLIERLQLHGDDALTLRQKIFLVRHKALTPVERVNVWASLKKHDVHYG